MSAAHPFEDAQLDACVEAAADDPGTVESGLFSVTSKDRANRALWKLGRIQAELAADEALYTRERAVLDDFIERRREQVERQRSFLEGLLVDYRRAMLAAGDKRRTISFPAGELKVSKARDEWVVDDAVFIRWAEANGRDDLIRRPDPQVARNEVKKALKPADFGNEDEGWWHVVDPASGEVVEGVTFVVGDDLSVFTMKPREVER